MCVLAGVICAMPCLTFPPSWCITILLEDCNSLKPVWASLCPWSGKAESALLVDEVKNTQKLLKQENIKEKNEEGRPIHHMVTSGASRAL